MAGWQCSCCLAVAGLIVSNSACAFGGVFVDKSVVQVSGFGIKY